MPTRSSQMDYMDPIETARRVLLGENLNAQEEVELIEESFDFDEEEVSEEEVDEAYHSSKKKMQEDDDEDEDEEKKNKDDEDEDDVSEGSESKTLDTKSEEDKNLYRDATGKGAKIDTDKGTEGKDKKNKGSVSAKSSAASAKVDTPTSMEHHVNVLFAGEDLSEEFKNKATTIFEAAINERVTAIQEELREDHDRILGEHTEKITKDMAEKLDDYLSYVVNEWVSDNELAIESGIRNDIAENFLSGLKDLFDKSYVDIPEEKSDLVDTLAEGILELEERLEKEISNNIDLQKEILNSKAEEVFTDVSEDMVDTDSEKLKTLAEGLEFDNIDSYRSKLETLKESYFGENIKEVLIEDGGSNNAEPTSNSPVMENYMDSISRLAKVSNRNKVS